jgi:hypothetical protein
MLAVIGPLLFQAADLLCGGHDPAVGEGMLLLDLVVGPAGRIELGQDVDAAGIGFGFGNGGVLPPPHFSSAGSWQQDIPQINRRRTGILIGTADFLDSRAY